LNGARTSIETQTGASTHTIDAQAIAAIPGGELSQIRSGSGISVFAPQYGPRRGCFGGMSWKF